MSDGYKHPITIGRVVLYRTDGRNGLAYDLPAIVTCTKETHPGDYPDGSHNPLPVPESDDHVHLTVFTPGGYGSVVARPAESELGAELVDNPESEDFVGAQTFVPGSGTYVEWNVPFAESVADPEAGDPIPPRSWRWPVIK